MKNLKQEWEGRFDEKFPNAELITHEETIMGTFDEVDRTKEFKRWLHSFISQERAKVNEGLIKKIEKIKKEVQKQTGSYKYDSCYDDVINLLTK